MISNAGLRYYSRKEDKEYILLEDTIIDVEFYSSSNSTKTLTGRLSDYSGGILTIDSSEAYNSNVTRIATEEIRSITVNKQNIIKVLEL